VSLRGRPSFDADESTVVSSSAPVAVTSSGPPPVLPATPQQLEFTSELSSDSKRLMKPLAERLRRVSTGSMHIEVGTGSSSASRPTPHLASHSLPSPSTSTSGFRKCMN